MHFLRRRYNQKPPQWGPISAVAANVADWFNRHGMPVPLMYMPMWEGTGTVAHDLFDPTETTFHANTSFGNNCVINDEGYINTRRTIIPTTDFTVSTIVEEVDISTSTYEGWFGQYAGGQTGRLFFGTLDGELAFRIGGVQRTGSALSNGETYHGILTRNGSQAIGYLDGVQDINGTASDNIYQSANTYVSSIYTSYLSDTKVYLAWILGASVTAEQVALLTNRPYAALQRHPITFFSIPAGGPTTYQESLTDGVSVSDVLSSSLSASNSLTDGGTVSDSLSNLWKLSETLTDGVLVSDSLSNLRRVSEALVDGLVVSDQVSAKRTMALSLEDGVSLSDSVENKATFVVTVVDGVSLSDDTSGETQDTMSESLSDGVTVSDSCTCKLILKEQVQDGVTVSDALAVLAQLGVTIIDGITVSDSCAEYTAPLPDNTFIAKINWEGKYTVILGEKIKPIKLK